MKRCLVISDSFKGTLSSPAICCIARSLAVPGWQVDALPVADGGEGTVDCFLDACGGQRVTAVVSTPSARRRRASTACCPTARRWWSAPLLRGCRWRRDGWIRNAPPPTAWDS